MGGDTGEGERVNILGIDCGGHTSLTVLDTSAARPRFVHTETLRIGHDELRKKPRLITPSDGREPYMLTHRTVVDDADVDARLPEIEALILLHSVRRVIFERVRYASLPADPRAAASIATHLLYASEVRRAARDLAMRLGCQVVNVTAGAWRWIACGLITGTRAKLKARSFLATKIPELVEGWPERSDDHQRDAAGLVLWDIEMARRVAGDAGATRRCAMILKGGIVARAPSTEPRVRPGVPPRPCGRCGAPERHALDVCPTFLAARAERAARAEKARERGEAMRAGMFVQQR